MPTQTEHEWAVQAKAEAKAKYPDDPVAAQWAYRKMVMDRAKARSPAPASAPT